MEITLAGQYFSFEVFSSNYHHSHILQQISKMLRQSAWKKEQSILEDDSNNLSILKKEINKQSEIDASVQLSINQKIETLKVNATVLAKKLQNEKHKNVQLETIISHLRNSLQKEKLQEASFRDSNSFQSLSGLENRYKKYEYDLGQLNGKTNRIAENVEQKRTKINQNRTERVIDSGIFRNIEKELIESELKFKKLLIEKIKYQKEYEKLLKKYEGLKEHAENYNEQRQSKLKPGSSFTSLLNNSDPTANPNKKFTNIDIPKEGNSNKPKSMTFIQEEQEFQEQKNIITIKKLLSQTGLENCQELLYHFYHIDEVNDKYFNQMMVYADQSNEIERYLSQFSHLKGQNKLHFYETKRKLTKNQTFKAQQKKLQSIIDETAETTKVQMAQINNFFNDSNFKKFLSLFDLQDQTIKEQQNFDEIKGVLQTLQSHMNEILSKGTIIREQKNTSRSNQQQKLEELINRVRKTDENLNVMKKEEFQEEYHKILKTSVSKTSIVKAPQKRPSYARIKK